MKVFLLSCEIRWDFELRCRRLATGRHLMIMWRKNAWPECFTRNDFRAERRCCEPPCCSSLDTASQLSIECLAQPKSKDGKCPEERLLCNTQSSGTGLRYIDFSWTSLLNMSTLRSFGSMIGWLQALQDGWTCAVRAYHGSGDYMGEPQRSRHIPSR